MAMYRCNRCENPIDNDWHPCEVDPRWPDGYELVCPDCFEQMTDENGKYKEEDPRGLGNE